MDPKKTADVIIPVYQPGRRFYDLLDMLNRQTVKPERVIIMFTSEPGEQLLIPPSFRCAEIHRLSREEFDHGSTRNEGASFARSDYILFMTQDAVPEDEFLIERLMSAFSAHEKIAASYARQLPNTDCPAIERFTRAFNYPEKSRIQRKEDIETLGIRTFFCSDVCAMYDRQVFLRLGGFIPKAIFNEDMIFAAGAVLEGYGIAYTAEACVFHSHHYTGMQQFRRNFDNAVSQKQHPEVFERVSSEKEGISLVLKTAGYLLRNRKWYVIPKLVYMSGMKYLGFRFGKKYERLRKKTVLRMTMNKEYWRDYYGTDSSDTL